MYIINWYFGPEAGRMQKLQQLCKVQILGSKGIANGMCNVGEIWFMYLTLQGA